MKVWIVKQESVRYDEMDPFDISIPWLCASLKLAKQYINTTAKEGLGPQWTIEYFENNEVYGFTAYTKYKSTRTTFSVDKDGKELKE